MKEKKIRVSVRTHKRDGEERGFIKPKEWLFGNFVRHYYPHLVLIIKTIV